jgi:hypothetical protein
MKPAPAALPRRVSPVHVAESWVFLEQTIEEAHKNRFSMTN